MTRCTVLLVAALGATACADLLGVEAVRSDEGVGGGGGAGGHGAVGLGAGLPVSGADASSPAAVGSSTASSSTAATSASSSTASTGAGSQCNTPLPPCPGAAPNAFGSSDELGESFDADGDDDEVEVDGGRLELEPREGWYAAVKSKSPVVAPLSGACAVWVDLVESTDDMATGIAIGTGTPSEDAYRVERRGLVVAARVGATDVAQVPFVKDVTRHLRIWLDASGNVGFDVSADGACWSAVGAPVAQTEPQGLVRLYVEAESGRAKLDDFCR